DPLEEVDVAGDGGRFRRDSDAQARYALDALEDFPCDAEPGFSRLVRIRRRADRHFLPALPRPLESGGELCPVCLLDIDAPLELGRVRVAQIAVGRPGIAVSAAEFASPKRIDGPAERKALIRNPVHELGALKGAEFYASPLVDDRADPLEESRSRHSRLVHIVLICLVYGYEKKAP